MANIDDFMKRLDGTDGLGLATTALFTGDQPPPVVHQAFDIWVDFDKAAADGAAGTATADTFIWTNPYDFNLVVADARMITLGAGLTADNANFATVSIKTDNGAGGATATALSLTTAITDTGNFTSNVSKRFTLKTGANVILAPGANLFFNIAKSGTGVVVPISSFIVRLQKSNY
jgi:hypothetical protein